MCASVGFMVHGFIVIPRYLVQQHKHVEYSYVCNKNVCLA